TKEILGSNSGFARRKNQLLLLQASTKTPVEGLYFATFILYMWAFDCNIFLWAYLPSPLGYLIIVTIFVKYSSITKTNI
ncbi:hypothetical protein ACJX0J_035067, partial [Zea mays]